MPVYFKNRKQQRELRFFEWLLDVLDRQRSPKNAYWLDRKEQIFAIRWVNAKSSSCSQECWDLFRLWKEEGGRSWTKDRREDAGKRMKTNFRMNLRSPNFVELPKEETRGEYPVRVFQFVERCNSNARSDQTIQRQNNPLPTISHGYENIQVTNEVANLIKAINMTELEKPQVLQELSHGLNNAEACSWSNNPTGSTPRMISTLKFSNKTPREKYSSCNASLETFKSIPPTFFKYHESKFQDIVPGSFGLEQNSTNQGSIQYSLLPSAQETLYNFQPISPLEEIDGESTADYLRNLETYPGSIQEIIPNKQKNITIYNPSFHQPQSYGNKANDFSAPDLIDLNPNNTISRRAAYVQDTETLRHTFVSSPTDSGFIERLSTRSLSSVWSSEDTTAQGFGDTDFVWPLDELSDQVFD